MFEFLRPKSAIYVVNESTLVEDAEVRDWCRAVQTQIKRDAAPAWRKKAKTVRFLGPTTLPPKNAWVIAVLDDADQAGALGYHSTDSAGRVYGKVFVKTCLDYGVVPSTCFSHEVLETWGDPSADAWARNRAQGWDTPLELCDAVENGTYVIAGVAVSNFLYPAWFGAGGVQMDHLHAVRVPFKLDKGGYAVIRYPNGTTDQIYGMEANRPYVEAKAHEMSRVTHRQSE
jgi:hypothetical protein